MTKELIESIRQSVIPFVKKELLDINYEGLGKSDAEEFEKDLNEVLDMAIKALEQQSNDKTMIHTLVEENEKLKADNKILAENCLKDLITCHSSIIKELQPTCEDCVSRQLVIDLVNAECVDLQDGSEIWRSCINDTVENIYHSVKALPPVIPTQNWNLISEYEPPKDRQLMFCNNQGSVFISRVTYQGEYFSYVGKHGCYENKAGENTGNIIAWAELPKPYEDK